jgi:hypothetical protein
MQFASQSGAESLERGGAFQGSPAWSEALGPGTSQLDPEDLATCLAEAVGVAFAARAQEERSWRTRPDPAARGLDVATSQDRAEVGAQVDMRRDFKTRRVGALGQEETGGGQAVHALPVVGVIWESRSHEPLRLG